MNQRRNNSGKESKPGRIVALATVTIALGAFALPALADITPSNAAAAASAAAPPPATPIAPATPIYKDPSAPLEDRVADLMSRLTPQERIGLLSTDAHGFNVWMIDIPPIPRLGIPPLRTTDAPQALRVASGTAFPMGVVMASTWDPPLIGRLASALGEEAHTVDRQVIYGPEINIQRTPQSGRFFENMSEDPFLTSEIAVSYIQGLQSQNIAACPKHFFGNNQETGRHTISVDMDERTMREIYLPAFRASVTRGHAWSIMGSVNKINDVDVVASRPIITDMLKKEWGWDGLAIADWSALHDTAISLNAGVDMDIPEPRVYSPSNISAAIANGSVTQAVVDESARRVVRVLIRTKLLDDPATVSPGSINTPEHQAIALKTAEEGMILLKNAGAILPLDRTKIKSIAVIGPNAADTQLGGRWSAESYPSRFVRILEGIRTAAGPGVTVTFAQGCHRRIDTPQSTIDDAVTLAAKSDIAIVVPGTEPEYMGEEIDPPDLYLPGAQEKLIQAISAANKNTIVVLNHGGPLVMSRWLDNVPAILETWYSGQEQGVAVGNILFGDVNPSGKLTATIAVRREDYSDWGYYPGANGHVQYAEGIYVGYRHFDKEGIAPLFPFGFGLSYTTFAYSKLIVPKNVKPGIPATVTVTVQNTGTRAGDEIVELYTRDLRLHADRPVRELKGFKRVHLNPGEQQTVTIPIDTSSFSSWDTTKHAFAYLPGYYGVDIGASSRDIRLTGKVKL